MSLKENQPKTSNEEEEICEFAHQLVSASVLPMALKAAIELNVLEIIAQAGPGAQLSSVEIASNFPTQKNPEAPYMLERILRLLASHSVLNCSCRINNYGGVQRMYGLGPVCRYFVPNQDGASLAPLLLMFQDKAYMESWYHLKDAVLEGEPPFNKAHGMNAIKYLEKDPRFSTIFRNSMTDYNIITMKKILDMYKGFEGVGVLVDVGGGVGSILNMIVSKHPKIKGINFDLPQLIEKAPSYPGVEHVGGDMFASVPKGDAIFMKWILHTWNDEHCLKILKNCYDAVPENGKVVIMDLIIPESTETIVRDKCIFQFDLSLMNMNPGGKERTETEFDALAKKAGFVGSKVMLWSCNFSIMEFYKMV